MHIILFSIAALVSFLGTIAGFGGGIYIVPIMVMGFGVPIELAIGVTAFSLFPSSLYSSYWNFRNKTIDFKLMFALEIPTMIGAIFGAKLTYVLPTKPLEIIFSLFLVFLAYRTLKPSKPDGYLGRFIAYLNSIKPKYEKPEYSVSFWASTFFGFLSGTIAGLFGIGGGILKTPVMINIFKVPVKIATSTALCMIVFTSFASGFTHYKLGHVNPELLIACGGGFLTGAVISSRVGLRLKDHFIKRLIAISIFLAGVAILIHALALKVQS